MKKSLTLSFARLLQSLVRGDVNYAEFTGGNRKLLTQFIDDNVLDYRMVGRQQKKIFCPDLNNLAWYLQNKFEIPSLDAYIIFLEREEFQRSDAVLAASDSKIRKTKVFTGFLVNCYEALSCELNGLPFVLQHVSGAFTFISAYNHFSIPENVTVVIVENHENFREIHRQRYLFDGITPLFVWRYQNSNAIAEWLNLIPNNYIHFGDFDLKGIHIFLSEFKNKISGVRGGFLKPDNLESLLMRYGMKSLYDVQKNLIPSIQKHNDVETAPLIELILKYKKGLSQEILIR